MKPVKIGLVGTGSISNAHMTGYSKLAEQGKVELVAACDLNVERAKAWAKKYGFREVYGSHKEMLEKSDIDAISVCTWNKAHAQITIDALRAGKHVLCEKPPAMTVEEALAMQQAEKETGKILMIGFVRRFGRNADLVLEFAKNGFFGDVNFAKIAVTRRCGCPLGWFANSKLSGGGPLLDNGVETENAANRRAFGLEYTEETVTALDANWQAFIKYGPENKVPVGTGSYMVSKMTDTDCIMVKNPYYYNLDKLGFEAIHFVNVDNDTKFQMLQNGELSRSDGTPAKDVLEGILESNPNLVHYMTLDNASVGVAIDQSDENLSKPEVRQAIAYVLNRDAIREVGNFYGTTSTYAAAGMPESYIRNEKWVSEDVASKMTVYETNHEKATELLESVGWTKKDDGWYNEKDEKISWITISTSEFQFLNAAQIFSQQLTAFGLNTELKVLEPSVFTSSYTAEGAKDYEFACNWIDNCWGLFCPYGPLQEGYYRDAFAARAGSFPKFTEGNRKGEINMVYADQNGEDTDISALLKTMLSMSDEEMVDAASRIAYITNENVFSISFFQNASGYWLNQNDIEGLPLPEQIEAQNRNIMVPTDPEELNIVNDHWYIWVAQGLVLSNGTYQAK